MATKAQYQKHKEKRLAHMKAYYQANSDKIKAYSREYYHAKKSEPGYKEKKKLQTRANYVKNREKILIRSKERWFEQRQALLEQVGNAICKHCGYTDVRALQIDHVNGGGRAEVRNTKFRSPQRYAAHIALTPENYQVLCANCNWIKRWENNEYKKKD